MVKLVVLFAGKRKTGKDYCCSKLLVELQECCAARLVSLSHSLKREYAAMKGLPYSELITDGPYKEQHRLDMIKWGESKRKEDSEYFCRQTILPEFEDDVIIVTDCRRPTDIDYFTQMYSTLVVRVECPLEERMRRGFVFTEGIDDAASECALDDRAYDVIVHNSGDAESLEKQFEQLLRVIERRIS